MRFSSPSVRGLRPLLRRAPLYLWRVRVALTPMRIAVALTVTIVVLGVVGWVLLGSHLLVVRTVQVVGEDRVTTERVRAAAAVRLGTPLARVDTEEVGRRVEKIRQISSARVERRWPSTLRVRVQERRPIAVSSWKGRYVLLDRNGVIVAVTAERPASMPVLKTSAPKSSDPASRAALAVLHALPGELAAKVATVHASSPSQVKFRLRSGDRVIWGSPRRSAEKARTLVALLHQEAHVYNVSSPDVATTR